MPRPGCIPVSQNKSFFLYTAACREFVTTRRRCEHPQQAIFVNGRPETTPLSLATNCKEVSEETLGLIVSHRSVTQQISADNLLPAKSQLVSQMSQLRQIHESWACTGMPGAILEDSRYRKGTADCSHMVIWRQGSLEDRCRGRRSDTKFRRKKRCH